MSSPLDINATVTYTDAGATATLGKVAQATKATGAAAAATTTNVAQFGSTMGLVGQAVGKFNGGLGQTVSGMGAALGSIQAMTTAGLGPLGIALGIVTTAISLGVVAYNAYAQAQDTAIAKQKELRAQLDSSANSFDGVAAASRRMRDEVGRADRLAAGRGTTQEYRDLEESRRRQLGVMLSAGDADSPEFERVNAERLMAQGQLTETAIARRNALRRAEEYRSNIAATGGNYSADLTHQGGGGGRSRAASTPDDASKELANKADAAARAAADAQREAEDAETELRQKAIDDRAEASRLASDQAIDDEERRVEGVRRAIDREMEARRESAEELADIQNGVASGFQVLNDAILLSAGSSEKAQKQAQSVMAGVAVVEAGIQAALEVARAAASYPDVVGMAAHATAAAAFVVAGVKAATMGGGSAPSGGGGAPAARTGGPSMSGGSHERGGDTIIVNLGSTALYAADKAQLGRDLDEMIGASRSRLGRTG